MVTGALSLSRAGRAERASRSHWQLLRQADQSARGRNRRTHFAGRGFQAAMVRAHARAWAMSMTAGTPSAVTSPSSSPRQSGQSVRSMMTASARQVRPSSPGIRYNTAMASISIRNSGAASAETATSVCAGIFFPKNSSRIGP